MKPAVCYTPAGYGMILYAVIITREIRCAVTAETLCLFLIFGFFSLNYVSHFIHLTVKTESGFVLEMAVGTFF